MTVEARELELFIVSNEKLYFSQHLSINKDLRTKQARKIYDRNKAIQAFEYLAESGAKAYNKEFGSGKWYTEFDKATRREVAVSLRNTFEDDAALGNFDDLLPKKYQEKK